MVDTFSGGVIPETLINKGQKNFQLKKRRKINTFVCISTLDSKKRRDIIENRKAAGRGLLFICKSDSGYKTMTENQNTNTTILNEIIRPCIDSDNVCITKDGVKVCDCVLLDNGNISGYTEDHTKALYSFDKDSWYFGKDIGRNNLVSLKDRTESERKEIVAKAHEKARENREQKKNINDLAKAMLEQTMTEDQIQAILGNETTMLLDSSVASVMLGAMIKSALAGSFKAFEAVRDTAGYRPKDISQVDLNANVITEADKSLIDKALKTG